MTILKALVLTILLCSNAVFADFQSTFQQAQLGNATAKADLGIMYIEGQGLPQNDNKAVKWFRLAAKEETKLINIAYNVLKKLGYTK